MARTSWAIFARSTVFRMCDSRSASWFTLGLFTNLYSPFKVADEPIASGNESSGRAARASTIVSARASKRLSRSTALENSFDTPQQPSDTSIISTVDHLQRKNARIRGRSKVVDVDDGLP